MKKHLITLLSAGILLGAVSAQGAILLGAWDFNDISLIGDQGALPVYETNVGTQSGVGGISLDIKEARADSGPFEINNEGNILGDTWNSPAAVAGNAVGFLHGSRVNGTHVDIIFDASSITTGVTLNFALRKKDNSAVDEYQASYSINGTDFTNVGSLVTLTDTAWNLHAIDFGTVFSGSSTAIARFTLGGGEATWNEEFQTNMDNVSLIAAVPEPSTYALFAGFLALGGVMLRRRLKN
jgi:hypothetical protein